eukprot:gb/GFBE01005417.1/.p1 GENE.gb/GFBE01005417.1/~~gb/GFBE01005417.1/.p1  ORF type:complete len:738 (+),score=175.70 gb/GFBE01005417.1/:1-2214(+)
MAVSGAIVSAAIRGIRGEPKEEEWVTTRQTTRQTTRATQAHVQKQPSALEPQTDAMPARRRVSTDSRSSREKLAELYGEPFRENEESEPETLADSWWFNTFVYSAIMVNAVVLGLQVDLRGGTWDQLWLVSEHIFTTIFLIELVMKIGCWGLKYFCDAWNWMDAIIVVAAVVDSWLVPLLPGVAVRDMSVLQLFRLFRIGKLLRMKKEMMAIIEGIIASMQCMVWIGLLMFVVIYTFAIFCCMSFGNNPNEYYGGSYDNELYFGTLLRAMLTLFNVCLIDGWSTVVWPQMNHDPIFVLPLMAFLVVTCFGLMNALIGLIVERTTAATQKMQDMDDEAKRHEKMMLVSRLVDTVSNLDADGDGTISVVEMEKAEQSGDIQDIVSGLNLPPGFSVMDLYQILDDDASGELHGDEFVQGIYRIIYCDAFQSSCLTSLRIANIRKDIRELHEAVDRGHKELRADIAQVVKTVKTEFEDVLERQLEKHFRRATTVAAPTGETGGSAGEEVMMPIRPEPSTFVPQSQVSLKVRTQLPLLSDGLGGSPSPVSSKQPSSVEEPGTVSRALRYGNDESGLTEWSAQPQSEGADDDGDGSGAELEEESLPQERKRTWVGIRQQEIPAASSSSAQEVPLLAALPTSPPEAPPEANDEEAVTPGSSSNLRRKKRIVRRVKVNGSKARVAEPESSSAAAAAVAQGEVVTQHLNSTVQPSLAKPSLFIEVPDDDHGGSEQLSLVESIEETY